MKTISVCIPTYEMGGHGHVFLKQSLDILCHQTYKDFDVVISDHSQDNFIEEACKEYEGKLTIHYVRNMEKRGSSSANINNAIRNATGQLIKILFQDDFLYHDNALADIVSSFNIEKDHWLVTACIHSRDGKKFYRPFYPRYTANIHLGHNTISSPSVLTIKNDKPLLFNEDLIWLMDVEYYKRCYNAFGEPTILNTITVVNRTGAHQVSNILATRTLQRKEFLQVLKTYEHGQLFWYYRSKYFLTELAKRLLRRT